MRRSAWIEGTAATLVGWLFFVSIPVLNGGLGLSWDALNHHIYLGWSAEGNRLAMDFWAAGSQSYQHPYLYWPAYKLMQAGASGTLASVVLCTLNALIVPPLWIMSRQLISGDGWVEVSTRLVCLALGLSSPLVISVVGTTSNDILSAMPMMWAIALLLPGSAKLYPSIFGGLLIGISIAFKLSNAPIAIAVPFLVLASSENQRSKFSKLVALGAFTLLGYLIAYLPWGLQLLHHYGNFYYPIHPLDML